MFMWVAYILCWCAPFLWMVDHIWWLWQVLVMGVVDICVGVVYIL